MTTDPTRRRVVLATRNTHKIAELRRILTEAGVDIELVPVSAFDHVDDVVETGLTFAQNAILKARAVAKATGLPVLADDSGLTVDALAGMPGVFSARWAGRHGDDVANRELVLSQLSDIPDEHLGAAFVAAAALAVPSGGVIVEEGRVPGRLVRKPRGSGGFGYDPIFVPDGHVRTLAEMSAAEKDAISHRGRAVRALATRLPEALG
ncbi:MAG TPA: RdgB/HAM1 family non-canonical purine NTP pyrophosphatase [Jiangellaceae bacterium]|nr:RdgB/HAM1 family non-canonical purine NTP pyrophosphatase [Jiangellaceae bacterium]